MNRREAMLLASSMAALSTTARPARLPAPDVPATEFGPGVHRIDRDFVAAGDLRMAAGATLAIAAGATLTVHGDVVAGAARLFTGAGRVDLSRGRTIAARPEWWGAIPDDPATDCGPALAACLDAHVAMQLGAGDYWLASTWTIDRSDRRVWGIGRTRDARSTRLVLRDGDGPVVRLGTEESPPGINDYVRGIDLRWIALARGHVPAARAGIDEEAATGLRVRHVLDCRIEGVRALEHPIGFSLRGAVRTFLLDCAAFRSSSSGSGRDIFVGFDLDGRDPPIPTGANASLYIVDCGASLGGPPRLSLSAGCRMRGAMSDTFVVRFETATLGYGILIEGGADRLPERSRRFGHGDVHLDSPVLDGCSVACIAISGLADNAAIEITAPYGALSTSGREALAIERSGGFVGVTGGQFWGAVAPGSTGVRAERAAGLSLAGTKLLGFARPVAARDATGLDLVVAIGSDRPGNGAAIALEACRNAYLRPRIAGAAGAYATGIEVDAASGPATIETIGIAAPSVTGAAVAGAGAGRGRTAGLTVTIPAPG